MPIELKTLESLLDALRAADTHLEYQGDDPALGECTRLVDGFWEMLPPWPEADPVNDWEAVRPATDAEVAHTLAAELLYMVRQREANAAHLTLGRAVAKVLPDALASATLPPRGLSRHEAEQRLQEVLDSHTLPLLDTHRTGVLLGLLQQDRADLPTVIQALFPHAPTPAKGNALLRAFRSRFKKAMEASGSTLRLTATPVGRQSIAGKRLIVEEG